MKKTRTPASQTEWQISPEKVLFSNRIMQMVSSQVRCGRTNITKDLYRFDFPSWVNIIAVTNHQEILFIRQYRFGTNRVELEIPGGAVNDNEDPLAAGLRELLEETGYAGENGRVIGYVNPNPAIQGNCCYTVLVENVRKVAEPQQDDMEDIEVLILPEQVVHSATKNGTIRHGLVLNGLMFYQMEKTKNHP